MQYIEDFLNSNNKSKIDIKNLNPDELAQYILNERAHYNDMNILGSYMEEKKSFDILPTLMKLLSKKEDQEKFLLQKLGNMEKNLLMNSSSFLKDNNLDILDAIKPYISKEKLEILLLQKNNQGSNILGYIFHNRDAANHARFTKIISHLSPKNQEKLIFQTDDRGDNNTLQVRNFPKKTEDKINFFNEIMSYVSIKNRENFLLGQGYKGSNIITDSQYIYSNIDMLDTIMSYLSPQNRDKLLFQQFQETKNNNLMSLMNQNCYDLLLFLPKIMSYFSSQKNKDIFLLQQDRKGGNILHNNTWLESSHFFHQLLSYLSLEAQGKLLEQKDNYGAIAFTFYKTDKFKQSIVKRADILTKKNIDKKRIINSKYGQYNDLLNELEKEI